MRYFKYFAVLLICLASKAHAQTDLFVGDLHKPTLISPYYFGPNAFPVPDMLDGTVLTDRFRLEFSASHYMGFQKDKTTDLTVKLTIPLFTDRINLSLWMPVMEAYRYSIERMEVCRLPDGSEISGYVGGDLYVSTDIWVLQSEKHWIDASLRAAVKTASGNGFAKARHYDAPGYFFDATLAKPLRFPDSYINGFRIAASGGFLCWQTGNGRQNDAVMYGLMLKAGSRHFTVSETFGGYMGWEEGTCADSGLHAGDHPMSLKTDLALHFGKLDVLFRYQYGIQDWPFHQLRIGIAYNFAIDKFIKR